ncbi:hypothetical protein MMC21_003788 [Puttea exsequens]|nr:hypothetical protein [Puttea exsequens]
MNAPDTAVPTPRTLRNFAKIAVQYHEKERQRECRLAGHLEACNKHKEVFNRLQKWDHFRSSSRSAKLWQCIATRWQPPQIPNDEELLELAKHYFPPRSRLSIHIIDFKKDETIKHHNVELKDIEKYWTEKDDDVEVRWIHAPLGLGPVHSTIEDVFLHQAPEGEEGRNFENVGNSGWPYPQLEVLNFRSRARFQEMRDVRSLLQCLDHLQEDLNKCTWERYRPSDKNTDSTILDDLKWRATHLNITQDFNTIPDFWTQVSSDIPWQVTEGLAMASYGPLDGLKPTLQKIDHQALWDHDFFGSAQLVRDPFRCFHRGDGFLLTLSPMAGVNYLDKHFSRHLEDPISAILENDDASAVALVLKAFEGQGTKTWHRRTVEHLIVYIVTEIGVTPHPDRQGYNAPTLESAYQEAIQVLKRRRYDHFSRQHRQEPADLVKDHLIFIDELTRIGIIIRKRAKVFISLLKDVETFEAEDQSNGKPPDNPDQESSRDRVLWAIRRTRDQQEAFERLLVDATSSLNAVYELRSLQQNDLAIISENQNRAMYIFATVTVIFLPLGTLTSYWGMNVVDIRNSNWSQGHFWKICGAFALAVVLVVALWAFKHWWYSLIKLCSGRRGRGREKRIDAEKIV